MAARSWAAQVAPEVRAELEEPGARVALAASCGFALPVATPPNALVFGTGRVGSRQMLRAGLALDATCIAVITAWGWLALRWLG